MEKNNKTTQRFGNKVIMSYIGLILRLYRCYIGVVGGLYWGYIRVLQSIC